eukprot:Gb_09514 [translate_table: standard]
MTYNAKLFKEIKEDTEENKVVLGDNNTQEVKGKGVVSIKTETGETKNISDVLLVPGLKMNLLSVGQMMEQDCKLEFDNGECLIKDKLNKGKVVAKGELKADRLFKLVIPPQPYVLKMTTTDESILWHCRYGYLNYGGLVMLRKNEMVAGLPFIQGGKEICEGRIYGKQHRDSFLASKFKAREPLELVHTDLCGTMRTLSMGKARYFMTFIDDYTKKIWVYFLKEKSEAFMKFFEFRAMEERQSGYKLRVLRSDNAGEYISNEFKDFCKKVGIQKQYTTPYMPQQNGIVERKNRTIQEIARSMMKAKNIGDELWAEGVYTVVYLLNRSPTKALVNKTPEEAWTGTKPDVSNLKIFGRIAYAHVPDEKRTKMESKSIKCIFIGYSGEQKTYRLYDPKEKKLIVSRNVIFNEDGIYKDEVVDENKKEVVIDFESNPKEEDESQSSQTQKKMTK